jgi:hypothetical protein
LFPTHRGEKFLPEILRARNLRHGKFANLNLSRGSRSIRLLQLSLSAPLIV